MTSWNEENFLEEIVPLLRQKQGPDWCPDAETLCALAEDSVPEAQRDALIAHKGSCPACSSLYERVRRFEGSGSLQGADWSLTEGRLDSWLKSFLGSDEAVHAAGIRVRQSGLRLRWQKLTETLGALQIRWYLIPAAALALLICSFLIGRVSVSRHPQLIAEGVRSEETLVNPAPPQTATMDGAAQGAGTKDLRRSQAVQRPLPTSQPNRNASGGSPSTSSPAGGDAATGTAATTPPASTTSERPTIASTSAGPQPTGTIVPPAPANASVRSDTDIQAAQTTDHGSPVPSGQGKASLSSGVRSVATRSGDVNTSRTMAKQPLAFSVPPEIGIEAGTRVWISLKWVGQPVAGVSEFSGVLLLPLMQSGSVLLDRDTQISGTVGVKAGKTIVQVTGLVLNGAHYALKGTGGSANAPSSGTGAAVKFDAGKVLETWMATTSLYGKLPEAAKPREK